MCRLSDMLLVDAYKYDVHRLVWSRASNGAHPFAKVVPGLPEATFVVVGAMAMYTRAPIQLIRAMNAVCTRPAGRPSHDGVFLPLARTKLQL